MIIVLKNQKTSQEQVESHRFVHRLAEQIPLTQVSLGTREVLVLSQSSLDPLASQMLAQQNVVEKLIPVATSYQLVSRAFQSEDTRIEVGNVLHGTSVTVGNEAHPIIMAGPCSVENREQVLQIAHAVKEAGAHILRGGAFKPRTSPYQFRGLGVEGLRLLAEARQATGLPVITEVMEPALVDVTAEHADILQIGSRNMHNFPLLTAVGKHEKKRPVLLKRGLCATLEEWLLAAEYIVVSGNPHVILCERGIRSYDQYTRNILDLSCIPLLRQLTHLPVVVDPSHATGRSDLVPAMSCAALAAGASGLLIEVHTDPDQALSDGKQSITPSQLAQITQKAGYAWQMAYSRQQELVGKN